MATISARLTLPTDFARLRYGRVWSTRSVSGPDTRAQTPAEAAAAPGDQTSLADLTLAASRGDEAAFESLHRRVGAGLRRVLMRRSAGRPEVVEDILQTTWSAVWQALRTGKYDASRSAITTFVYAVGHNAWLTHLRKTARDRAADVPSVAAEQVIEAPGASAEHLLGEAEAAEIVRSCLRDGSVAGLSDQERMIVRCIAAGESDRGLARRLGISSSTVNVKKHSGMAKIRVHLERCGIVEDGPERDGPELGGAEGTAKEQAARGMDASPAGLIGGLS